MSKIIKTVIVTPTKEMPKEIFVTLHRIAYYMELMKKIPGGRRVWDDAVESIYSESSAEVAYLCLRKDWFVGTMELPKKVVDRLAGGEIQGSLFAYTGGAE